MQQVRLCSIYFMQAHLYLKSHQSKCGHCSVTYQWSQIWSYPYSTNSITWDPTLLFTFSCQLRKLYSHWVSQGWTHYFFLSGNVHRNWCESTMLKGMIDDGVTQFFCVGYPLKSLPDRGPVCIFRANNVTFFVFVLMGPLTIHTRLLSSTKICYR